MDNQSDAKQIDIKIGNRSASCPILEGNEGHCVLDIKKIAQELDIFTLDEGLRSTAFCKSKITFIDGEKGILLHRGYPIDQLVSKRNYTEICYLLMHGEIPDPEQTKSFNLNLKQHQYLAPQLEKLFLSMPDNTHPMTMLMSSTCALASCNRTSSTSPDLQLAAMELISNMPILAAMCYRRSVNKSFIAPNPELSYSENFLYMMFGDNPSYQANPTLTKAIDHIFTLHADHEQNASTATVRLAGSTGTNPYSSIAAGIAALAGPAHGGANEAALHMLEEIGSVEQIDTYLEKAKDSNDPFRLMGFGHRVYKNYDPRAKVMHKTCHDVLDTIGEADSNPLFKIASALEKIAAEDEYFVSRKLYPNIDFYSGITLNAIGIPTNMFTVIFALSRTVGWVSHLIEMNNDPDQGLIRPRQLYIGNTQRNDK